MVEGEGDADPGGLGRTGPDDIVPPQAQNHAGKQSGGVGGKDQARPNQTGTEEAEARIERGRRGLNEPAYAAACRGAQNTAGQRPGG